ncbi:DUF2637 domain-containing protein [Streptomyces caniscabiei]|uniref:DUF2637 domain-containing protein n=1 Tax=Streptomyces caniscabiei TaxID=2746961 RepID=A0ABU4MZX0_9ACTN|nr:DUF2637 domain-containing protein [Streptomyces caniscabiei]MBE4740513.1 DUF2637 domain-containing protein [Streptomyces caniscabiei]MBE4761324.1 DUF2637 domain-containing protein [Streptomyces caniscabiei]MBE4773475.1 DUF2637 domain-containing protein [Streptomyces caniscabiei]MBE4790078.1 DUF2637 domain-containing protein [Streptomyces caniscabiei]MBE4799334.1 DUF2637 domain-containing protein [Streptomyces caniscabiei]
MNRIGKTLLVLALVAVVVMAFRVSWNALRDVARVVGADATAATLYPFVVDGLMALALVATLVLTDQRDKRFALRVLAVYTLASLVLNYVHGLVPELHGKAVDWGRLADWDPANWALVLLATSLPVGSIYFGSDLVAKVLHHQPTTAVRAPDGEHADEPAHLPHTPADTPPALPDTAPADARPDAAPAVSAQVEESADAVRADDPHTPHTARTPELSAEEEAARQAQFEDAELERMRQDARRTYAESVQAARPLSARALGEAYGMSESWARKQILAVREADEADRPHLVAVGGD